MKRSRELEERRLNLWFRWNLLMIESVLRLLKWIFASLYRRIHHVYCRSDDSQNSATQRHRDSTSPRYRHDNFCTVPFRPILETFYILTNILPQKHFPKTKKNITIKIKQFILFCSTFFVGKFTIFFMISNFNRGQNL